MRVKNTRVALMPDECGGSEARVLSPADLIAHKRPDAIKKIISKLFTGTGISSTDKLACCKMTLSPLGDWGIGGWHLIRAKIADGSGLPFTAYMGMSSEDELVGPFRSHMEK